MKHIPKLHLTNADNDAPVLTFVPPPSPGGSGNGGGGNAIGKPTPNATGPVVTPAVVEAVSSSSPSNRTRWSPGADRPPSARSRRSS